MDWIDEEIPNVDEEEQTKTFIKNELMNFYFYVRVRNEYKEKVEMYEELQDDPSTGGSFAKMPEPSQSNSSPQKRLTDNKIEVEYKLALYTAKVESLKRWLGVLTESQYIAVKVYVMKYQCKHASEAEDETGYKENTLKKYSRRAINRIYSRISKFY